jgi:phospholipid transport system transporter-binding protein
VSAADLVETADGQIALRGALDQATVPELWRRHSSRFGSGAVTVDLSGVSRCDSAGLALLVDWLGQAVRAGGEARFETPSSQLLALARVADVDRLLGLEPAG